MVQLTAGIYFGCDHSGFKKVGESSAIEGRLSEHRSSNPSYQNVRIFCCDHAEKRKRLERTIHKSMEEWRVEGTTEWFNPPASWWEVSEEVWSDRFTEWVKEAELSLKPKQASRLGKKAITIFLTPSEKEELRRGMANLGLYNFSDLSRYLVSEFTKHN